MQTESHHAPGCLLVISATTCPAAASAAQAILQQDRSNTRRGFQRCITRAIASGELPADTDARSMALMFDTFVRGLTTQSRDGIARSKLQSGIKTLMTL